MKILWHSNAPWVSTGYGNQTAQVTRRLRDAGHDVAISAFYGLQGSAEVWDGMVVYPQGMHPYGNDVLLAHAEQHFGRTDGGLIITLVDAWVLPTQMLREAHVACWAPVDHEPAPARVIGALRDSGAFPVAMSEHGQAEMNRNGLDAFYAPHGIDTSVLKPMDKQVSRQRVGLPDDKFVVGMVAANKGTPSRKGFGEAFQAFAAFHRKHPDTVLYLHTEAMGVVEGVNLIRLAAACGIPESAIVPMHQYHGFILGMPAEHMPYVYSAIDVLLNPSNGEGFGIPIIEAQACGTPVIVTDWTAMRELAGPGWKVDGQKWWTSQESWGKVASVEKLTAALTSAHKKAAGLRDECVAFAARYDADRVFAEHWRPIIRELEDRVHGPGPVAPAPAVEVERIAA